MTKPAKTKTRRKAIGLNVDELADCFSVTAKTVRAWIRDGLPVLKAGSKGSGNGALIHPGEALKWFLGNGLDPQQQRARKDSALAARFERENLVAEGKFVDIEEVSQAWTQMIANARARLLAMPTKLAAQLINVPEPGVVMDRIKTEVYAALNELAANKYGETENG